jgi:hypothetical protein
MGLRQRRAGVTLNNSRRAFIRAGIKFYVKRGPPDESAKPLLIHQNRRQAEPHMNAPIRLGSRPL